MCSMYANSTRVLLLLRALSSAALLMSCGSSPENSLQHQAFRPCLSMSVPRGMPGMHVSGISS